MINVLLYRKRSKIFCPVFDKNNKIVKNRNNHLVTSILYDVELKIQLFL